MLCSNAPTTAAAMFPPGGKPAAMTARQQGMIVRRGQGKGNDDKVSTTMAVKF